MQTIADLPLKTNDRCVIEATVKLLLSKFPVEQITLYGSKVSVGCVLLLTRNHPKRQLLERTTPLRHS